MDDLPEVAAVPWCCDRYLIVRWDSMAWVNVETGLIYGPDLPADAQRYTPELALASAQGQLADVARDHHELRGELRKLLDLGERLGKLAGPGSGTGTAAFKAGVAQAYFDTTAALRDLLDRDAHRVTQDQAPGRDHVVPDPHD
jgi:hypothetical protein